LTPLLPLLPQSAAAIFKELANEIAPVLGGGARLALS